MPGVDREAQSLQERFSKLRPEVLEILRVHGHGAFAFTLAEDYGDFRTLVALCHTSTVYPPNENPNAARIEGYIERFKDAFTSELYQWYIEHG